MPAWNRTAEVMAEAEAWGGIPAATFSAGTGMAATLRPLNSLATLCRFYLGQCPTMEAENSKGLMLLLMDSQTPPRTSYNN